jgi:hypothetical protein
MSSCSDYVAKAKFREIREQLLMAEAAIGEHGDTAAGRQEFGEPAQARILEVVALILQFVLSDGQPQQRCGAAVAGDQV